MKEKYGIEITSGVGKWNYNKDQRSQLTDISAIKKFSTTIKNTVKYIFLNNNFFSSIECLADFKKIYELDVMGNSKLLNLNGLENHTNLVYVFAQKCDLQNINGLENNSKLYGLSITSNSNLKSLNGLENSKRIDHIEASRCNIIEISALQNNINLRYLELSYNVNLKSVIALKNCTGLRKLFLANNEQMLGKEVRDALADPETHILQNCGGNYTIPSKYNIYFSTLTSYDYSNLDLTDDSDEINSLKNKTTVTRLNLSGNPKLSNSKLQEILSTMTGLKALSLNGCVNLESIDFINEGKVTNLIELDLRNTKSVLIDLSNLNDYGKKMLNLIVNNENIQVNKIQETINNIYDNCNNKDSKNYKYYIEESWIAKEPWMCRGIILLGNIENYSFAQCDKITGISCSTQGFTYSEMNGNYIDLSNCTGLKEIYFSRNCGIKFPENLSDVGISGNIKPEYYDLSETKYIESFHITYGDQTMLNKLLSSCKNNKIKVKKLGIWGTSGNGLRNLDLLKYIDKEYLTSLQFGYADGRSMILDSLDGIEGFSNLQKLVIYNDPNLSSIEQIKSLNKLTELEITKCEKLNNLNGIENLYNLQNLLCTRSGLNDITQISKLTNLGSINFYKNSISEVGDLSKLVKLNYLQLGENNISNLDRLNPLIINGKTNLITLELSNNIIQTTSINGNNNVETLKKLYNAGLRTLDISGNNFTAGSTDELKSLKWTSYKE